jgi:membrane-bound serine protease (ClpP class)
MSCDEIVMGPSASLGDCAPIVVSANGLEPLPPAERAKMEAPIRLDFDESAARNHHDPLLAAAMVSVEIEVHWLQSPTGQRRFVDADDYKTLTAAGWKPVPGAADPIDSSTTLLTVDTQEAVQYGLATQTAASAADLAQTRGYRVVADLTPGPGEKLVELLSGVVVRGILLVIFLQCLYIFVHAPGHGVAETVGLAALGLMLGVPLLTGYATWWEILAIFIGLALVAVEIILPGHILPGVTGATLVFTGIVLTFVPKEPNGMPGFLPTLQGTWTALENGLIAVVAAMACSLLLWVWLNRFLPKLPYFNRLILTATSGGTPVAAGTTAKFTEPAKWPPLGSPGKTVSELKPGGMAQFFDDTILDTRIITVQRDSGWVGPGVRVLVRAVEGNRVVVRADEKQAIVQ